MILVRVSVISLDEATKPFRIFMRIFILLDCLAIFQQSNLFKVTHISHAMCHVLSATLDTIILQYSTSFLYCTNIKIHKRFIKYNVRKTVNPI